jgi:hypothetical protein
MAVAAASPEEVFFLAEVWLALLLAVADEVVTWWWVALADPLETVRVSEE